LTPTNVVGLSGTVTSVTAGDTSACAVAGGAASCWGERTNGRLGDSGSSSGFATSAVGVSGMGAGVTMVAGHAQSFCAVQLASVKCWGKAQYNNLGNNSTADSNVPVAPTNLPVLSVAQVDIWNHACAVLVSGQVWCWGFNDDGRVGTGTTGRYTTATRVDTLAPSLAGRSTTFSAGGGHSVWLR
jgi:alpha-tubulin suppressor-like RCC1 family protein